MTVRNLDALFEPRAIALIGASNQPGSVGEVVAKNLFSGGFKGPVLTVNPHEDTIFSALNYRSIADLPLPVDLAVVATPAATVPGLIDELGRHGCRAAIVISAGFTGARGAELRQKMLNAARPHLLRILGPNCLGFLSPARGINASFAHRTPPEGSIAFVSQSGAIATAVIDWACARGIGFSHVLSVGDTADIDIGDLLDYLALDARTRAILVYAESITNARKFMSAGRIAARLKPVVVLKSGRSSAGAKAAASHTGALAGSDTVYEAAIRRAGMLRVPRFREMFDAAEILASGMRVQGERLAVLTNGGGLGVLAVDELAEGGGQLAELAPETLAALDGALPSTWSHANPVDILGDAPPARYRVASEAILKDRGVDAMLVINCPIAVADSFAPAEALVSVLDSERRVPVLTCWSGDKAGEAARALFAEKRIPTFETPEEAVRAFLHLVGHRRNQQLLMETPAAPGELAAGQKEAARGIARAALAEGRTLLSEPESKRLLAAYGIPTVPTEIAADPAAAARCAAEIGAPVALKILSPQITHKSDVGGVRLELATPAAVEQAAAEMLAQIAALRPDATIDGFTVQPMVTRPHARELLAGIADDDLFGPVIVFGHGGTAVEAIRDRAVGLPPLNDHLAKDMIGQTRIARLLDAYRNVPAAALDAVVLVLLRLSQIATDIPEIAELDINPLLADEAGVIALDARVVLAPPERRKRPAIRPYPAELEKIVELRNGARLPIRPIRPEDAPALIEMVQRSSPEDVSLRFMAAMKTLSPDLASRLTQIDYDREMAFVALEPHADGPHIVGVSHLFADPDNEAGEYSVMVRTDRKGIGLGYALMQELIAHGRRRGIERIFGIVWQSNADMLRMARELGFATMECDEGTVRVQLDLTDAGRAPVPNPPSAAVPAHP